MGLIRYQLPCSFFVATVLEIHLRTLHFLYQNKYTVEVFSYQSLSTLDRSISTKEKRESYALVLVNAEHCYTVSSIYLKLESIFRCARWSIIYYITTKRILALVLKMYIIYPKLNTLCLMVM